METTESATMKTTPSSVARSNLRRLIRAVRWVRRLHGAPTDDAILSAWTRWSTDPDNLEAFERVLVVWEGFNAPEPRAYLERAIEGAGDNNPLADVPAERVGIIQELRRNRDTLFAAAFRITQDADAANAVFLEVVAQILKTPAEKLAQVKELRIYCLMLMRNFALKRRRRLEAEKVRSWQAVSLPIDIERLQEFLRGLPEPPPPTLSELLWNVDEWGDLENFPDVAGLSSSARKSGP